MSPPEFCLNRAYDRLAAAEALIERGLNQDAINRLYYASLEATKAILSALEKNDPLLIKVSYCYSTKK